MMGCSALWGGMDLPPRARGVMKSQLLTGVAVAALVMATPALAAPPAAAQIYNWTGFYVGGNVGYSWGDVASNFNAPGFGEAFGPWGFAGLPTAHPLYQKPDGFIGGVQVGHNWQIDNRWVFGIEADFQGSDEKASRSFSHSYDCEGFGSFFNPTCNLSQTHSSKIHWFDTVRARFGVLMSPTTLVYATAGLAWGKVSVTGTVTDDPGNTGGAFRFHSSGINFGYALGAGVEGAFPDSKNWTWKVEYLYLDLGSLSGIGIDETITGQRYSWDAKFKDQILRVGINYRFYQP